MINTTLAIMSGPPFLAMIIYAIATYPRPPKPPAIIQIKISDRPKFNPIPRSDAGYLGTMTRRTAELRRAVKMPAGQWAEMIARVESLMESRNDLAQAVQREVRTAIGMPHGTWGDVIARLQMLAARRV
jgi:hypothetical protein